MLIDLLSSALNTSQYDLRGIKWTSYHKTEAQCGICGPAVRLTVVAEKIHPPPAIITRSVNVPDLKLKMCSFFNFSNEWEFLLYFLGCLMT